MNTLELLLTQVVSWLNYNKDNIGLSETISLYKCENCNLWVESISKPLVIKRYTDGSYIGNIQFLLYHKLEAVEVDLSSLDLPFWQIASYIKTADFDELGLLKFEMQETPAVFERKEDGTIINKAIFTLEYKQN